ncbi:MAG TPA: DUF1003 domain-containing protein [Aliidongia sp.]|nr:DUF1003 domain-containing protein [Aliidongia sp.]
MAADPTRMGEAGDSVSVMARNIAALRRHRAETDESARFAERAADHVVRFAGGMSFVLLHLIVLLGWILINTGWIGGVRPFDPTFITLATGASVEAIFLSTFILMSQKRAAAIDDRHTELDLQMSLLAEHEITRLLGLTLAIARHLGIDEAHDPLTTQLAAHVAPEEALHEIARGASDGGTRR